MGSKQKRKRKNPPAEAAPAAEGGRESSTGSWVAARLPVLKYFGIFAVSMAAFYAITATPPFRESVFPAYLNLNAQISGWILALLGENPNVDGFMIFGDRFSLTVQRGCDATEPAAVFGSAVLAFPASWRQKLWGLGVGLPVLLLINIARIVSLYYTGVFFPDAFEIVHVDVWQPLFILLSLLFWLVWVVRATRRPSGAGRG